MNSGQRRNSQYRFLLRWPEFIFPPPQSESPLEGLSDAGSLGHQ